MKNGCTETEEIFSTNAISYLSNVLIQRGAIARAQKVLSEQALDASFLLFKQITNLGKLSPKVAV